MYAGHIKTAHNQQKNRKKKKFPSAKKNQDPQIVPNQTIL